MKPFKSWTPKFLITLYENEVNKLVHNEYNEKQRQVQSRKADAFYHLGTYEDMKDVWEKLLAYEIKSKYPVNVEEALVGGILEQIWINPFGEKVDTPKEKNQQLGDVTRAIKTLQRAIKKAGEARHENQIIMETILHKKNMEHRNQRGEKFALPANQVRYIDINARADLSSFPLDEHMPWKQRNMEQRLGWWTKEAMAVNLTEILDYYSERMTDYSRVYKDHYAKDTSKLCRGLSWLMNQLYGKDLDDYVARIMNVVLDVNSWDKDKVRKNRSYKKA